MTEIDTNKWGIIGHDNIISYLSVSLKAHKFAHAYLLAGPKSLGKKTVANKFIQTLLCEQYIENGEESIPCGNCQSCKHLIKGMHPDYYRLELQEDKKNISIEQVRDWQRQLQHKSFLTKYKVGVIVGAEHLSIEAANALLKTIEEPTGNTIIILITDDINLLLPTIVSRSQVLKFSLVSDETIYDYLQKASPDHRNIKNIAKLSFGLPGKAINYLNNDSLLEETQNTVKEILDLMIKPAHDKLAYLQNIFQKKDFVASQRIADKIMDNILLIARELLLHKESSDNWYRLEFVDDELKKVANSLDQQDIINIIDKVYIWKDKIKQNASPLLFTEDILLSI
ncbi:MAG: ATP-binding protein [Candidatus Komeilibacteria bacterium]